ncbi:hypothetical protein RP20_CCG022537 [Aedes albopictus]|nr:hypothetical protein RP20_CCG022537 [Aedes albopictus]
MKRKHSADIERLLYFLNLASQFPTAVKKAKTGVIIGLPNDRISLSFFDSAVGLSESVYHPLAREHLTTSPETLRPPDREKNPSVGRHAVSIWTVMLPNRYGLPTAPLLGLLLAISPNSWVYSGRRQIVPHLDRGDAIPPNRYGLPTSPLIDLPPKCRIDFVP